MMHMSVVFMSLSFILRLLFLSSSVVASSLPLHSRLFLSRFNASELTTLHSYKAQLRGLNCNLRICFLLDGSNQVDPAELAEQKNFVDVLLAIITPDLTISASLCAYIYATQSHSIVSPLTEDRKSFLRVLNTTQPPTERGIANAGHVLRDGLRTLHYNDYKVPGHENIVLFAKRKPVFRAPGYYNEMSCFKKQGGNVWGIAMSGRARPKLEHVADRVFTTAEFFDVAEVIVGRLIQSCEGSRLDLI